MVKNTPGNARGVKAMGSIAGSGRSLGEGYGNPLQYSSLGNLKHSEAWRATVHGVTKICTRLSTSPPPHNMLCELYLSYNYTHLIMRD